MGYLNNELDKLEHNLKLRIGENSNDKKNPNNIASFYVADVSNSIPVVKNVILYGYMTELFNNLVQIISHIILNYLDLPGKVRSKTIKEVKIPSYMYPSLILARDIAYYIIIKELTSLSKTTNLDNSVKSKQGDNSQNVTNVSKKDGNNQTFTTGSKQIGDNQNFEYRYRFRRIKDAMDKYIHFDYPFIPNTDWYVKTEINTDFIAVPVKYDIDRTKLPDKPYDYMEIDIVSDVIRSMESLGFRFGTKDPITGRLNNRPNASQTILASQYLNPNAYHQYYNLDLSTKAKIDSNILIPQIMSAVIIRMPYEPSAVESFRNKRVVKPRNID